MASQNGNNGDQEDNSYEALAARYLEQHRRARDNDAAMSAFNVWENEVRNDH